MTRQAIVSPRVVPAKQPISHAVKAVGLVFLSATHPWREGYKLARGDFADQMRQCLENLKMVLEDADTSVSRIVKLTIIHTRMQDADEMNAIYAEFIREHFPNGGYPARTSYQAAMARRDFLVEIECVAEI